MFEPTTSCIRDIGANILPQKQVIKKTFKMIPFHALVIYQIL